MGGHGALTLFLKNPGKYKSVSAFAPIANPGKCPWGEKAFTGYLGDDREEWKQHDATELVRAWKGDAFDALIDVGTGDNFYKQGQLLPENFEAAVKERGFGQGVVVRYQEVRLLFEYAQSVGFDETVLGNVGCTDRYLDRLTTTAISSLRHLQPIISITLPSICSHSKF
jgi:S-formylglutathione hydrolase FrmB